LVEIWKEVATGLLEKDQVDIAKTEKLFADCAALVVEDCWNRVLFEVVTAVRSGLLKIGSEI